MIWLVSILSNQKQPPHSPQHQEKKAAEASGQEGWHWLTQTPCLDDPSLQHTLHTTKVLTGRGQSSPSLPRNQEESTVLSKGVLFISWTP